MSSMDKSHDGGLDDSSTVFQPSFGQSRLDSSDDYATVFHPSSQTTADSSDDSATVFRPGQPEQNAAVPDADTAYKPKVQERDHRSQTPKASTLPAVGQVVLDGRYTLVATLTGGKQALAFKARDEVSGGLVFLKISENVDHRGNGFQRQIALRDHILDLRHRNLLRCFNMELNEGRLVEVYEYLEGISLAEWLETRRILARDEIRSLIIQLSEGIQALQTEGGLVHRDVKPDNVMVLSHAESFLLKIVDYGTACRVGAGGLEPIAGTRHYSPPECLLSSVESSEELLSWDWWSLGRIVQRAVDGVDIDRRISELSEKGLLGELSSVNSRQAAASNIFSRILWEEKITKKGKGELRFHMRAGMVELSEQEPAAKPWISLLRGLLTKERGDRWGYREVQQFMAGATVEEFYHSNSEESIDFMFEGNPWDLGQLALHLINESAKLKGDYLVGTTPSGTKDIWEQARTLALEGSFSRHIRHVVNNIVLFEDLVPYWEIHDHDLATALILRRLAEAQQPPVVKNRVVDRQLALNLAGRTEARAHGMFTTVLSSSYLALHRLLHPESASGLEQVVREIADLRKFLVELDVRSTNAASRFSDQSLLLGLASEAAHAIRGLDQFKVKLGRTDNPKLQTVFAKKTSDLSPMERASLLLALAEPATNKFVSYDTITADLKRRAESLRVAAGLSEAAALLSNHTVFVFGDVWARMLAFLFAEGLVVSFFPTALRSQFLTTLPFWVFCVVLAVAFGSSKLLVPFALKTDIRALDPEAGSTTQWQPKLLKERAGRWLKAPASSTAQLLRELDTINEQLRMMPGAGSARLKVARPSFPRIRLAKLVQVSICIAFLIITTLTGFVLKSEADEQKRFFALTHPKPFTIQNGREMYRGSDLSLLSHGTKKYYIDYNVLHLEGNNVVIVGDVDRARIWEGTANLAIQGNVKSSEIKLDNGSIMAGSVSQTGMIIKREGTVTIRDVSHSTIEAKHIIVHSSDASSLICETAHVTGTVAPGDISKHPWRNIP